ncbi:LOW QUALITY PROTEIN: hypothetical protein TorRG33x02_263090 [Trema orientale]|uniref:Uncharacterized protein n=1 Tax=Trema orientale TaxID=63057 RepID=A0A2P5D3W5_TREOI|nr:LOW QUALITY PROTEIN: hypothetical protein TorRG33x02_263090 [Trema orientale]
MEIAELTLWFPETRPWYIICILHIYRLLRRCLPKHCFYNQWRNFLYHSQLALSKSLLRFKLLQSIDLPTLPYLLVNTRRRIWNRPLCFFHILTQFLLPSGKHRPNLLIITTIQ